MFNMKRVQKALVTTGILLTLGLPIAACSSDADVASKNLSQDAEDFKIVRRVVFYNAITDTYILVVEGRCSVTCKIGDGKDAKCQKDFLGKSDNVLWFAEQLEATGVGTDHYKVFFKPTALVPDVAAK